MKQALYGNTMRLVGSSIFFYFAKFHHFGDKRKMGLQLLQRMLTLGPMEFPETRVTVSRSLLPI
jgi:hypothetical protein